jgi:hypothetical protein
MGLLPGVAEQARAGRRPGDQGESGAMRFRVMIRPWLTS